MINEVMRVKELSKIYRIYNSHTDRLMEFFVKGKRHTDFVALDRISFSVGRGETLGIIGENGAGKSTLLHLIAGTLSPTAGEIVVNGKVFALLELGVGFHPDFTGKENIFFYGDILGYSRGFIQSKFNGIVDFSELGDFIDRPIKTYSTGMQMRLAFSLISSLEPDILIVDEALSVGDMHFQKKCIDRITEFKDRGMTLLFCSHSTYQVGILCNKVIWLKAGKIEMCGEPQRVIPAYDFYQLEKDKKSETSEAKAASPVFIEEISLMNTLPLRRGDDFKFRIRIISKREDIRYHVVFSLKIDPDWGVYATGTHMVGKEPLYGKKKEVLITFPNAQIMGGFYFAHVRVFDDQGLVLYHEKLMQPFEVEKDSIERGVCYLENHWEVRDV
jgi:ABC-type polysaccharide/polyol phosphate transport system ATPase subunit